MKEAKCESCGTRPAMMTDLLCKECSERYATLLKSAMQRTRQISTRSSQYEHVNLTHARQVEFGQLAQTVLEPPIPQEHSTVLLDQDQLTGKQKLPYERIGYLVLGTGLLALVLAVLVTSTILAFIGLGLAFWGVLVFFIRPQNYVRSDLMNAMALSSLKTIDKVVFGLGYREKGVYIPLSTSEKAVIFLPSMPFSTIPEERSLEGKTFLNNPEGLLVVPPGLALSNLIEKKLGFHLKNCGVENLVRTLPGVLEDLEIAREVEIKATVDSVKFRLVGSIYADFCREVNESTRRCALGCPMCSALACILAIATGKPVLFEEEKSIAEATTESYFTILHESRL